MDTPGCERADPPVTYILRYVTSAPETFEGVEQGRLAGLGINVGRGRTEIRGVHRVSHRFVLPAQGHSVLVLVRAAGCVPRMSTKMPASRRYCGSPVARYSSAQPMMFEGEAEMRQLLGTRLEDL